MARNERKLGRHQTIHSDLRPAIEFVRSIPEVDRVIIGISRGGRHNGTPGTIRTQTISATGLKIIGFSDQGASEFFIVTSSPVEVKAKIDERYPWVEKPRKPLPPPPVVTKKQKKPRRPMPRNYLNSETACVNRLVSGATLIAEYSSQSQPCSDGEKDARLIRGRFPGWEDGLPELACGACRPRVDAVYRCTFLR